MKFLNLDAKSIGITKFHNLEYKVSNVIFKVHIPKTVMFSQIKFYNRDLQS